MMHRAIVKSRCGVFWVTVICMLLLFFRKFTFLLDYEENYNEKNEKCGLNNNWHNQLKYVTREGNPAWYNFNISVPSCQQNPCGSLTNESAIIVIYTSIANMEGRNIIRNTYANTTLLSELNMRHIFLIGKFKDGENEKLWQIIMAEQEIYRDIVIGDFVDTYRNLSYKGLTALRFVQEYCKTVKWVIKLDDDTIANTPRIIHILRKRHLHRKFTLFGKLYSHSKPIICPRRPLKWCVNKTSIHASKLGRRYPNYLMGIGYVLTADLVPYMLEKAAYNPPFDIDDIYMTGILTRYIRGKKILQWGTIIQNEKLRRLIPGKHIIGHSSRNNIEARWQHIQEYNRVQRIKNRLQTNPKSKSK